MVIQLFEPIISSIDAVIHHLFLGRAPIMGLGVLVHTGLQTWMLLWRPHPNTPIKFFMAAGLWGVGDAVWQTQVNGERIF